MSNMEPFDAQLNRVCGTKPISRLAAELPAIWRSRRSEFDTAARVRWLSAAAEYRIDLDGGDSTARLLMRAFSSEYRFGQEQIGEPPEFVNCRCEVASAIIDQLDQISRTDLIALAVPLNLFFSEQTRNWGQYLAALIALNPEPNLAELVALGEAPSLRRQPEFSVRIPLMLLASDEAHEPPVFISAARLFDSALSLDMIHTIATSICGKVQELTALQFAELFCGVAVRVRLEQGYFAKRQQFLTEVDEAFAERIRLVPKVGLLFIVRGLLRAGPAAKHLHARTFQEIASRAPGLNIGWLQRFLFLYADGKLSKLFLGSSGELAMLAALSSTATQTCSGMLGDDLLTIVRAFADIEYRNETFITIVIDRYKDKESDLDVLIELSRLAPPDSFYEVLAQQLVRAGQRKLILIAYNVLKMQGVAQRCQELVLQVTAERTGVSADRLRTENVIDIAQTLPPATDPLTLTPADRAALNKLLSE
jgi:hypothetical protein